MGEKPIKLIVRFVAAVAIAAGITAGTAGMASARQIIVIDNGQSCDPVCKIADGVYTDWWRC